jgi:hypothetical protein
MGSEVQDALALAHHLQAHWMNEKIGHLIKTLATIVCLGSREGGGGGGDSDLEDGDGDEDEEGSDLEEKEGRKRAQIQRKSTYLIKATAIVLVSGRKSGSKFAWKSWRRKGASMNIAGR